MKREACLAGILLILSASAFGQGYDMAIHLGNGQTVTIPHDDIQRIEFANTTGIHDPNPDHPMPAPFVFRVLQNYPNPFNPSTVIEYEIPDKADVAVRVFNLQGALIRELFHETQPAGRHRVAWDGRSGTGARVASGVYFYTVRCGKHTLSKKLILVK